SLIVRSVTLGTLPPLAPEAPSSLPMLFSSASISHWASVLLIRHLPVGAPYRQEGRQVESHTARNYWTVVPVAFCATLLLDVASSSGGFGANRGTFDTATDQQSIRQFGRQRAAEKVALAQVAAELKQSCALRGRLDPLGSHRQIECIGKCD